MHVVLRPAGDQMFDTRAWRGPAVVDMAFVLDDVRSWGRSGNYLLFPSISHFDPKRK
jgi:hypothetical protein